MYKKIKAYRSVFNVILKRGTVYLKLENNEEEQLKDLDADSYSAILLTLKHDSVQWDSKDNCIGLGVEIPID